MAESPRNTLQLSVTKKASQQWRDILLYYTERNRSDRYSNKLDKELQTMFAMICNDPRRGKRIKRKGMRRCVIAKRFAVFYRFDLECVEIISIVDARRNVPLD